VSSRLLTLFLAIWAVAAGVTSTRAQGEEWWAPSWLLNSPYSPAFEVRDTVNKYGRYADRAKTITLSDLIKFHGHFCGGLVESAGALRVAFDELFGTAPIDRTDLRIASNNSACGGDVAAYLTGARTRFGSHLLDPTLTESEFVVQRVSNGKTVRVRVNPQAYPKEVRAQMKKIESGQITPEDIDLFQQLQWDYAKRTVTRPLNQTFIVLNPSSYRWPEAPCRDYGTRKDNDFKLVPAN
jgi:formylmethanofuran dehydrogenase subunit E